MFTESDFKELLGIKNIEITKTEIDSEGNFLIYVKSTNQEILCRLCGKETLYHHGLAQPVRLRHLPMCNRITYLIIEPKRGKCDDCDKHPTTNQRLNWYDYKQRHTKLYEDHILQDLEGYFYFH